VCEFVSCTGVLCTVARSLRICMTCAILRNPAGLACSSVAASLASASALACASGLEMGPSRAVREDGLLEEQILRTRYTVLVQPRHGVASKEFAIRTQSALDVISD
jgi:hypothetical protein